MDSMSKSIFGRFWQILFNCATINSVQILEVVYFYVLDGLTSIARLETVVCCLYTFCFCTENCIGKQFLCKRRRNIGPPICISLLGMLNSRSDRVEGEKAESQKADNKKEEFKRSNDIKGRKVQKAEKIKFILYYNNNECIQKSYSNTL
jgi:hypothetical protein